MRPNREAINKDITPRVYKKQILEHNIQPKKTSSSTTTYKVKTNGANLHVRSKPSTSGTILTKMPNGTKFEVTEVKSGWGKHTYNGKTGWSCLTYATKEGSSSSSSSSSSSGKYTSESVLEGKIKLKEPNLSIKAKKGVTLQGLGSKLSGLYFVESVEHTFDYRGYTQQITVSRSWKGESMKNAPVSTTTTSTPSTPPKTDKPVVTPTVQTRTYTIKKGDTLWAIAKKYYGKGSEYPKIFNANKDIIKDPNKIYPGQVIKIP